MPVFQETGKMAQYSHLFKSFLEFLMVHAVKGFGVVNETLVDVFLKFASFRYDPVMLTTCGSLVAVHFPNQAWTSEIS